MTHYAEIRLPICPVCGVALAYLGSDPSGERANFGCGAAAYKSYSGDDHFYVWTKSCESMLRLMTNPGELKHDD